MSDLLSKYNYVCWMVNNDSHRFVYDRDARQFSEFSPYEFKVEKAEIHLLRQEVTHQIKRMASYCAKRACCPNFATETTPI